MKETVLAILSPSSQDEERPEYNTAVQSYQGSRVNMHSLPQSRINHAKGRKRNKSLLYYIQRHPPLLLSLEMENEPEDLLFIFHIFSLRSCANLHGQEI